MTDFCDILTLKTILTWASAILNARQSDLIFFFEAITLNVDMAASWLSVYPPVFNELWRWSDGEDGAVCGRRWSGRS